MKTRNLVTILIAACLATAIVFVGCKKKEQPSATTAKETKNTAETAAASTEQTMCPIMDGNKINKNVFVEYKGKKVYFCCSSCKAVFEKDPEKYIAKLPQFAK